MIRRRRPRRPGMALLRCSLIVVLIASGARQPTAVRAQEPVVPPADVEDGQRLYSEPARIVMARWQRRARGGSRSRAVPPRIVGR